MTEPLEFVVEEPKKSSGLSLAVLFSFVLHIVMVVWFVRSYRPIATVKDAPIARYVELIRKNPERKPFVEAPGPKLEQAPLNAPFSDANRKASMPEPTGDQPTNQPGDGSGLYRPPSGTATPQQAQQQPQRGQQPQQAQQASPAQLTESSTPSQPSSNDALVYREPVRAGAAASPAVDWKSAIREVGSALGGIEAIDLGPIGGEKGRAEQGPLSFETAWYDWGEYAQSMVSRIRVNWDANMPPLFRTGMPGAVTIRFTIHRNGSISDVTILESSERQPYDLAAKKAIEQSSPLKPLPSDFRAATERVTIRFFYNMNLAARSPRS